MNDDVVAVEAIGHAECSPSEETVSPKGPAPTEPYDVHPQIASKVRNVAEKMEQSFNCSEGDTKEDSCHDGSMELRLAGCDWLDVQNEDVPSIDGEDRTDIKDDTSNDAEHNSALSGSGSAGYVFLCNNRTCAECKSLGILAAPHRDLDELRRCINSTTRLFLFNYQSLSLIGVFFAVGLPDHDIEPGAFGGRFSAHVRVAPRNNGEQLDEAKLRCRRITAGPKSGLEVEEFEKWLRHGDDDDKATEVRLRCKAASQFRGSSRRIVQGDDEALYPLIARYGAARCINQSVLQRGSSRYFGGCGGMSDDGHLAKWVARTMCVVCLDTDHQMWSCPLRRCDMCFGLGHVAGSCPESHGREDIQAILAECIDAGTSLIDRHADAEKVIEVRCLSCGLTGAGHVNCTPAPSSSFRCAEEAEQEKDSDVDSAKERKETSEAYDANHVGMIEILTHWGMPAAHVGVPFRFHVAGAGGNCAPVCATLRLVADGVDAEVSLREELLAVPPERIASAARELARLRAVVPGPRRGLAPQLTPLGWWLSQLSIPPAFACALVHGSLWGVLLPVAAVLVLLQCPPPDFIFEDAEGGAPPSEHYELVAAYLHWREARDTGSRRARESLFWNQVDERVVAVCKHAQQVLSYDGDDAAFEEMDGEVMDVRRRDGRPWTLASALGSKDSSRCARFHAALCAASPLVSCNIGVGWSVQTAAGDGTKSIRTVVDAKYAVLFAPADLCEAKNSSFAIDIGGTLVSLGGGREQFNDIQALRRDLSDRLAQTLESVGVGVGTPTFATMDDALVDRSMQFLRDCGTAISVVRTDEAMASKAASLCATSEDNLEIGILSLLGLRDTSAQEMSTNNVSGEDDIQRDCDRPDLIEDKDAGFGGAAVGTELLPVLPSVFSSPSLGPQVHDPMCAPQGSPHAGFDAKGVEEEEEEDDDEAKLFDSLAAATANAAFVRLLKRRAVIAEDYGLAARLKAREAIAGSALQRCRDEVLARCSAARSAALDRLASRKRKCVDDPEQVELITKIRRREVQVVLRPEVVPIAEFERVLAEKAEAVKDEDFDRAGELRSRQLEIQSGWTYVEELVASRAVLWAEDPVRREELIAIAEAAESNGETCGNGGNGAAALGVGRLLSSGGGDIWGEMRAELQAFSLAERAHVRV